MVQYDVYKLKRGEIVVVLQHDSFKHYRTRVVAPLVPRSRGKLATSLNPVLRHGNRDWVLATHLINVIPLAAMSEHMGTLEAQNYTIKRAVDQLFLGI